MLSANDTELYNRSVMELLRSFRRLPITRECAERLVTLGVDRHHIWNLMIKEDPHYIIEYLPVANVVVAHDNGSAHRIDDEAAMAVFLLPTIEAKEVYLNEIH